MRSRCSQLPDYWEPAKQQLLVDPGKFMDMLIHYDKDNIPEAVIKKIRPYIDMENFTPAAIAKVSKACTSICLWCRAMYKYHTVALGVAPKRAALKGAQDKLANTMKELAEAQATLKAVQEKIATLEKNFADATKKKQDLADEVRQPPGGTPPDGLAASFGGFCVDRNAPACESNATCSASSIKS